ncbi:MAG: hypothetical protein KC503_34660 [Myxococcales bacterium]|nr:hypothetical protein [Myxococcales bacterium]
MTRGLHRVLLAIALPALLLALLDGACTRLGFDSTRRALPSEGGVPPDDGGVVGGEAVRVAEASIVDLPLAPDVGDGAVVMPCPPPRVLTTGTVGFDVTTVGSSLHVFASQPAGAKAIYHATRSAQGSWIEDTPTLPRQATGRLAAAGLAGDVHLLYEEGGGITYVLISPQATLQLQKLGTGPVLDLALASDGVANAVGLAVVDLPASQIERVVVNYNGGASASCREPIAVNERARLSVVSSRFALATLTDVIRAEVRTVSAPCTATLSVATPTNLPLTASALAVATSPQREITVMGLARGSGVDQLAGITFDATSGVGAAMWRFDSWFSTEAMLEATYDALGQLHVVAVESGTAGALHWRTLDTNGNWSSQKIALGTLAQPVIGGRLALLNRQLHVVARDEAGALHYACQALP